MCFHSWKIWKIAPSKLMFALPMLYTALSIGFVLQFEHDEPLGWLALPFMFFTLTASLWVIATIVALLMILGDDEDLIPIQYPFVHKDATCLKCGKSTFDATKSKLNAEGRKKIRDAQEKIARDNFNNQKAIMDAINETGEV